MEFVTPVIEVVKLILGPLCQEVHYLKDLEENVNALKEKKAKLTGIECDVNIEVQRGILQLKNPKIEVTNWLKSVGEVKGKVDEIEKEFRENKTCLSGCLPNYCLHRKLGKQTLKFTDVIDKLIKDRESFQSCVAVDGLPKTVPILPTSSLKGTTAERTFKSIWDCLIDENIVSIGVYGMGGVGKTTTVQNIVNHIRKEQKTTFSTVIMVTVSKDLNVKKLQSEIAEQIGLEVPNNHSEENFSRKLYEALLQRKNFLLILDDLWDPLSLEDVGVPKPKVEVGCKILLTTRSQRVCQGMQTQRYVEVAVLSPEESWSLFQEKVGSDVLLDQEVQDVARQVANECAGLPLAIITVGRALRDVNDVREWRNSLHQLRNSTADIEGLEDKVFTRLKFSYDRLRNKKLQACFLYCSLFAEDYKIHAAWLIQHWIWDGLTIHMGHEQSEVDNGRSLLNELKRACMLEIDEEYDTVKMHDLMRDMAFYITKDNPPHFMVKAGMGLEIPPASDEWSEDVERVSLMRNKIEIISGQPRCPKLKTFFLNENHFLHTIHHSFFDEMRNLCVLNLSDTRIEILPESLSNLESLHVLLLENCSYLEMVPSLEKLKDLRVLRISYAPITKMPESLSSLENLHDLNLEYCGNLRTVPSVAKLKVLKKLSLSGTSIEELPESLSSLENLNELELYSCEKLKTVPPLVNLKKLKKLRVTNTCITELPESLFDLKNLSELALCFNKRLKAVPSLANLKELRKLDLSGTSIEELPESLSELENLRKLLLYNCERLKVVPSLTNLKELKELYLSKTSIEELPESLSELENLHELHLSGCTRLKMVPSLEKLKELRVLNLDSTGIEELPKGTEMLVALEILYLANTRRLRTFPVGLLPKLSSLYSFSTAGSSFLWSANKAGMMERLIRIEELTGLTQLISVQLDCVDLSTFSYFVKSLQARHFLLRAVKSNTQPTSGESESDTFLLSLCRIDGINESLEIREHHEIIFLSQLEFLLDLGLMELKGYVIDSCNGIECVTVAQDDNSLLLPHVERLTLKNLPRLESLHRGTVVQGTLARLTSIEVSACHKLKNLLSLKLLQSLQSLERIEIRNCNMMEEVITGEDDETGEHMAFFKLRYLCLDSLPILKSICSKPLVCNSLGWIEVKQCPHLKKIPIWINNLPSYFHGVFEGKKEWWDVLDWDDPVKTKPLLQRFFRDEEASEEESQREELGEEEHQRTQK